MSYLNQIENKVAVNIASQDNLPQQVSLNKGHVPIEIKTSLISKNITIEQKRTSVRLEPEMWQALKEISRREQCSIHDVCTLVSLCKRANSSLTASIRVFLMLYFKAAATEEGHSIAGHGKLHQLKARLNRISTVQ